MHGGGIQGVVAADHPQEARRLLEGLVTEARHLQQLPAIAETAALVAQGDDIVGDAAVQPRDARQQGHRGRVDVHPHRVHAVLHHAVQLPGQLYLADIVLVLADAYGLGFDFHQFRQWILQAAGDRYRPANGDIQVGKLAGRVLRGGVDGRSRLIDHDLARIEFGVGLQQLTHEPVGFPPGGAVADGDQLYPVAANQLQQGLPGLRGALLRRVGIDGVVIQYLAVGIHHGHLDAGAQAGVEADGGPLARRRRQQQVLEVVGEHLDGLPLRPLAQLPQQLSLQVGEQFDPPAPAHGLPQPGIGGSLPVLYPPVLGDHRLAGVGGTHLFLRVHHQAQGKHALVAAPEHGQGAVRGRFYQRLSVFEVIAELGALRLLVRHQPAGQQGVVAQELAQRRQQLRVFGEALHQNLPGAVQGGLAVGKTRLGIEVVGGQGIRVQGRVGQQRIGQRLQPRLPGDQRLAAPPRLIGQVQVFQAVLGIGVEDGLLQGGGELALLADAAEDDLAALLQLPQVVQALRQLPQLGVVQGAGHFLAIAGDEGDGRPLVQQFDGGVHLIGIHGEFLRDAQGDGFGHGLYGSGSGKGVIALLR